MNWNHTTHKNKSMYFYGCKMFLLSNVCKHVRLLITLIVQIDPRSTVEKIYYSDCCITQVFESNVESNAYKKRTNLWEQSWIIHNTNFSEKIFSGKNIKLKKETMTEITQKMASQHVVFWLSRLNIF